MKQGYEKTSMQDLVDFMGIHRRSIYDTFGDKHALYMKALMRYESTQNKKLRLLVERQEASLEPEAISHYLMNAWLGLRTMVKTATEQRKLTSIIHTILNTLD
ncbi:TetR/AcrR family transcriptional regulator [Paenibacillus sp. FSL R10-2736]|uniref:TetR/AcrR family transcriptional regulator n=1 Tax=Paenibacillus sp. FSL R10-2736 TaxID=2954692 RepID=UPI0030F84A83